MNSNASPDSSLPTILIVDDTPQNLMVLGELLKPFYNVRAANSGERALRVAATPPTPDIITLDIMMPDVDGYEVIKRLKANPKLQDIPVIFVTSMDSTENEEKGLSLGAVDYLTKPINPSIALARIRTHLELKKARDIVTHQNEWLEKEIKRRMSENLLIQDLSVRALAVLAEARDLNTGRHILRTQHFVRILAEHLVNHERFKDALEGERLDMVIKAAPLHDIGKVGIPDTILLKPGPLTPEEFEIMKQHPTIGADAIEKAMQETLEAADDTTAEQATGAFGFLYIAQEIARNHHEKWNGSGYPAGLIGDEIPVSARLMALADVFDALTTKRVYKPALSIEESTRYIRDGSGSHFDPDVVAAFLECHDEFAAIAQSLQDPEYK